MSIDCYCDYDPATIYSASKPKARKAHRCDECGTEIKPGCQYENVFGVWDGHGSTWKTCERCYDLRQWVTNNVPCFCWCHGNMIEDAAEAIYEAQHRAPSETVGLHFGFLRRRFLIERDAKP
jgi:hypothetical protein